MTDIPSAVQPAIAPTIDLAGAIRSLAERQDKIEKALIALAQRQQDAPRPISSSVADFLAMQEATARMRTSAYSEMGQMLQLMTQLQAGLPAPEPAGEDGILEKLAGVIAPLVLKGGLAGEASNGIVASQDVPPAAPSPQNATPAPAEDPKGGFPK